MIDKREQLNKLIFSAKAIKHTFFNLKYIRFVQEPAPEHPREHSEKRSGPRTDGFRFERRGRPSTGGRGLELNHHFRLCSSWDDTTSVHD